MLTPRDLKQAARRIGATVDTLHGSRQTILQIQSPPGLVWDCCSVHCLCTTWHNGDQEGRTEAIADALDRMEEGLSPCDNPDCDYCHPEE